MTVTKTIFNHAGTHLAQFTASSGNSLQTWVKAEREQLNDTLSAYGAILLRNFSIASATEFQATAQLMIPELFDYTYRATPREHVQGKVYTSTSYPPTHLSRKLRRNLAHFPGFSM